MKTVGLGAKKDPGNDVDALKKENKALKAANTKLKNENESLTQKVAALTLENEGLHEKLKAAGE